MGEVRLTGRGLGGAKPKHNNFKVRSTTRRDATQARSTITKPLRPRRRRPLGSRPRRPPLGPARHLVLHRGARRR